MTEACAHTLTQSVAFSRFEGDPVLFRRLTVLDARRGRGTARQRWYDRHLFLVHGTAHASTSTSTSTALNANSISSMDWK